jgi:hypothetical protein
MDRNEGIVQHGGVFSAEVLAVGRRARAVQRIEAVSASLPDQDGAAARLRELAALVNAHLDDLERPDDVLAATETVAEELKKPEPNRLTLSAILDGIGSAASGVGGIAAAVTALRLAVGI